VLERITQAVVILKLAILMTVFAAGLIFISWFVEYLFNDINFVDWVIKRWYVHLGILSVALVICIETVVHANVTWRQLCALSSPLNDTAAKSRASHATAGVVFGENLVGQRTVTCDGDGLTIWKRGTRQVYFPWSRFVKIAVRGRSSDSLLADIELKCKRPGGLPTLTVPWSVDMTATVPTGLNVVSRGSG
jgi:hypothetical protein